MAIKKDQNTKQQNKIERLSQLFDKLSGFGYINQGDERSITKLQKLQQFKRIIEFIINDDLLIEDEADLLSIDVIKLFDKDKDYEELVLEFKRLEEEDKIKAYYEKLINRVLAKRYNPRSYTEILIRDDGFYYELKELFNEHLDALEFLPTFTISIEENNYLATVFYKGSVVRRYLKNSLENVKGRQVSSEVEKDMIEGNEEIVEQRIYFIIFQDMQGGIIGHRKLLVDPSKEKIVTSCRASGNVEAEDSNEEIIYCIHSLSIELLKHYAGMIKKKIILSFHDNQALDYFNLGRAYQDSNYNPIWLKVFKEKMEKEKLAIWPRFYIKDLGGDIDGTRIIKSDEKKQIEDLDNYEKLFIQIDRQKGYTIEETIKKNKHKEDDLKERNIEDLERILEQMEKYIQ